jgi:hypothetical protein
MGPLPTVFKVIFTLAIALVTTIWSKWWFDQRSQFKP